MKTLSLPLWLTLCLALLAGCAAPSDPGSAWFAVAVPQALSASASVTRVTVTTSAADFPSATVDLALSSGVWGGYLGGIPAGNNRTFLAQAFDASGTKLFEGSVSGVTITSGPAVGVAITLQQLNAPPPFQNAAPLIDSLVAPTTVVTSGTLSLKATAHDPNPGDTLTYTWSSNAGSFSSTTSASTVWTAPASTGLRTLVLKVTDAGGLSTSLSLTVNVTSSGEQGGAQLSISFNTSPLVASLSATSSQLSVGQSTLVSASASDADGDSLSYKWSASCNGTWTDATSSSARFTPSELPSSTCNNCNLTVTVSDGRGGQTTGTLSLCVSTQAPYNHLSPTLGTSYSSYSPGDPVTAGQVLTFEVRASDPEGSALSFSWAANTGALSTAVNSASTSRVSWTAPACVQAGTAPSITATVTNAFNQTATQSFAVTGPPACAN